MTGRRVVVIGNGMAGSHFVAELRRRDSSERFTVTVFGAERHAAYNRVLLSNVLAGSASAQSIRLASATNGDGRAEVHTGMTVTDINRAAQTVSTADGRMTSYDVLVLATGSRPMIPPIPGLIGEDGQLANGAAVFRTLDDCDRILQLAAPAKRAVVLGGGLLGLEAARGLAGRGLAVDLVHREPFLMERQLDMGAGAVLSRTLGALGIRVHLNATTVAFRGSDGVAEVALDDGTVVRGDLLVVACGVQPETALAVGAGLVVERGVVVDDQMRTSDPRVFAIGECVQHAGRVYGLVAPAWEQAVVLAQWLTSDGDVPRYAGSRLVTRLKAAGVELASMGDIDVDTATTTDEVVQFVDPARGTYKKVVIRDGRVVGAILLGDVATAANVVQLFDRGSPAPSDRLALLFAGVAAREVVESPALMPDRATVCRCNGVTKGAIKTSWLGGARTVDAVSERTRAGTGCGSCVDAVAGIVEWLAEAQGNADKPAVSA